MSGELARLHGMPLFVNPLIPEREPKIALSKDIDVSSEFRAQFDAKMLEWFGEQTCVYVIENQIHANPKTIGIIEVSL